MFKQNYHLLFLFLLFLLFSCSKYTTKNKQKFSNAQKLPGYGEQWLFIKTNGTNILPDVSKYNWMPNSSKRATSNALLNVAEFGPNNVGGRTRAVIIDYSDPNRIIAGGVSGGIFVSENKGLSWRAINDQELTPSVTGMSQNPFLPKVIYYCTGEGSGNSADIIGAGVFKSVDGGNSFAQLASTDNINFSKCWSIKCSPKDTNVLYVTTQSNGVLRSTNAGVSFSTVFTTGTEVNDLEILPDGSVLFAIKGGGIYRSTNGNSGTFTKVNSISSSSTARGELAYCKDFPNVVYAAVSGVDNGYLGVLNQFYKSSDGGKTFTTKTNPDGKVKFSFTWYCLTMAVKNNDSNSVYIASLDAGYSTNGGQSWSGATEMHSDHHVAFNVNNSELLVGCDGGICTYQWNDFSNYTSLNNGFNVTQFYSGAVSPYLKDIMGGAQDNGTNESHANSNIFEHIFGGDGAYAFYHNLLDNTRYVSYQNGVIIRREGITEINISNNLPASTTGKWFIQPYDVSDYNGDWILYPSSINLYLSKNSGNNFTKIGSVNTGQLYASTFSLQDNPAAYAGGQNSLIACDSVLNIKPKVYNHFSKLPIPLKTSFLNCVKVIPGYRDRLYLAYSNISDSGRIYKATNTLSTTPTFKNISGNLPKGLPVNWVECDPFNPERVIFAGTDFGLYVTEDSGTTWIKDSRVPNVVISSIKININKKDIYFFTHGRGIFKGIINNNYNVAINAISNKSSIFKLYPVPALTQLTVLLHNPGSVADYTVFSSSGQIVLKGKLETEKTFITIEGLPSGNYIFNIQQNAQTESSSFNVIR